MGALTHPGTNGLPGASLAPNCGHGAYYHHDSATDSMELPQPCTGSLKQGERTTKNAILEENRVLFIFTFDGLPYLISSRIFSIARAAAA